MCRRFENNVYMACINTYYEYIYNKLDMVLEFTSLLNILEMISVNGKDYEDLKKYSKENEEFVKNSERLVKIYNEIENIVDEKDLEFLKNLTKKNSITLNDKFKFLFYKKYNFEENDKSKCLIKKIKNTRKFFVHGSDNKDVLENVHLFLTKELIKNMMYILLIKEVTEDENINIRVSKMTIEMLYNNIINNIK